MRTIFKNHLFLFMICLIIAGCAYRSAMNDGKKLFEAGQYDDAIRYFETALQKKPQSADVKIWLKKSKEKAAETHYQKGIKAEENKEWTRAASEYGRVLDLIPDYQDASKRLETVESAEALEHYQKGITLKEAGKWDQALKEFEDTLLWAENFKDTHQKIKEAKESAAEEHYQQALSLIEEGKYEEALSAFFRCWNYVRDYKDSLKQEEKAKLALAEIEYEEGEKLAEQQQWFAALDRFKKADSWVNGYQDVNSRTAFVKERIAEEYYNKAVEILEEAKQGRSVKPYRQAMNYLDECLSYVNNFRDARQKYVEAEEGATVRVVIMPFQGQESIAVPLTQNLITETLNKKPKLTAFVDRQYITGFLLDEQDLAGLGMMDASSAVKIGKLARVHAVIIGRALSDTVDSGPEAVTKTAQYPVEEEYLSEGKVRKRTEWKEFSYQVWNKSRTVKLTAYYQLISALDGTIVKADSLSAEAESEREWVTVPSLAGVDKTTLLKYAHEPREGRFGIKTYSASDSLPESTPQEPEPSSVLTPRAMNELAPSLASAIINQIPRLAD